MLCVGEEYPVLVPAIGPAFKGGFYNICLGEEYPVLDPAIGSSYEGWFNNHVMFR